MDAAGAALAGDERLTEALRGVRLTVEQVVEDPAGAVRWHVVVDDGRAHLVPGPAADPDVRFTTDRATAAGIASGRLSAQRAFVEGRLRVGGDLTKLMAHQRAVAAVDDALAEVRAATTFD